jgi:hypothetical protein
MANEVSNCNCLHGEPYIDSDGVCRCTDSVSNIPPLLVGGKRIRTRQPQTINYTYNFPFTPQPAVDALANKAAAGTIFGMPPLLAIGFAVAGIYIFSQGETKK